MVGACRSGRLAPLKPWLQRLPGQQLTRLVLRPLASRDTGGGSMVGVWRLVIVVMPVRNAVRF